MKKIIMTRGLPASGKSSWAKEFVKNSKGKAKRVNKDDLREMIDGGVWSKSNEELILRVRDRMVYEFIKARVDTIIIDDTNFEHKHYIAIMEVLNSAHDWQWHELNSVHDHYTIEYKDFFEPTVDECIRRDALRAKPVGEKVIKGMWDRYKDIIKPDNREGGPIVNKGGDTIICDLDGTAAHMVKRGPFELNKVDTDIPDISVRNIVNTFFDKGYNIIFVSGREGTEVCKRLSKQWLIDHDFKHHELFMREVGDNRKDSIVKKEIYENHIKGKYVVDFVLDDRNQVVQAWRELGLKCLQCQPGDF